MNGSHGTIAEVAKMRLYGDVASGSARQLLHCSAWTDIYGYSCSAPRSGNWF